VALTIFSRGSANAAAAMVAMTAIVITKTAVAVVVGAIVELLRIMTVTVAGNPVMAVGRADMSVVVVVNAIAVAKVVFTVFAVLITQSAISSAATAALVMTTINCSNTCGGLLVIGSLCRPLD
jgi:hypothetical protein